MARKTLVTSLLVGMIALMGSACSSVTATQPLPRMEDFGEQEKLEGTWSDGDQVLHLAFDDQGVIHFAGVSWQEDHFGLERGEATVSEGVDLNLLSIRVQEKGEWLEGYIFAQFRITDRGDLLLWLPEVDAFADAVDDGRLEGIVERGKYGTDVSITANPEDLHAFINDPARPHLFNLTDPIILRRVE